VGRRIHHGPAQLRLESFCDIDVKWMFEQLTARNVKDVTLEQCELYWGKAIGDRQLALDAMMAVSRGQPFQPLRDLIEATRAVT
jgi:hypothetical protein